MLSTEALHQRKWGRFPALAKVLSDKKLSLQWTGPTSVSENVFDQVSCLLEIYALVEDYGDDLENTPSISKGAIRTELLDLSRGLAWAAERFAQATHQIEERAHRVDA